MKSFSLIARTLVLFHAFLLAACVFPARDHTDFKSGRSIFSPKNVESVASRRFSTEFKGSFDLRVTGLPVKIDPLSFIIGCAAVEKLKPGDNIRPWRGKLRIEALPQAHSKPVGWVVWNPDSEYVERRESTTTMDSFILRISVIESFDPHLHINLIYGICK